VFTDIHTCRKLFEDAMRAGKQVTLHYFDRGPRQAQVTPLLWDRSMVKVKRHSDGATWNLQTTFITDVVPV
jgi:hypothetical protein